MSMTVSITYNSRKPLFCRYFCLLIVSIWQCVPSRSTNGLHMTFPSNISNNPWVHTPTQFVTHHFHSTVRIISLFNFLFVCDYVQSRSARLRPQCMQFLYISLLPILLCFFFLVNEARMYIYWHKLTFSTQLND